MPNSSRLLTGRPVRVARAEIDIHGRRKDVKMVGQPLGQAGHHVGAAIAHEIARHLLQGDDVAVRDAGRKAVEVEAAVEPDAEMHIVGHELQFGRLRSVVRQNAAKRPRALHRFAVEEPQRKIHCQDCRNAS